MRTLFIFYLISILLLIFALIRWRHKVAFFEAAASIFAAVVIGAFLYLSIDEGAENKRTKWLNLAVVQARPAGMDELSLERSKLQMWRQEMDSAGIATASLAAEQLSALVALSQTPGFVGLQAAGMSPMALSHHKAWQPFLAPANLVKRDWRPDQQAVKDLIPLVRREKPESLLDSFLLASVFEVFEGKSEVFFWQEALDPFRQAIKTTGTIKKNYQTAYTAWLQSMQTGDDVLALDVYLCNLRDEALTSIKLGISGYSNQRSTAHDILNNRTSFPNFTNLEQSASIAAKSCQLISWQDHFQVYDRYRIRYYEARWQDGKDLKVEDY